MKMQAQIYPGLTGEELVTAIRSDYTPMILLNDTQVKDSLYARIFIEGDSVRCIYSGLSRFLPDDVDPSQFLFGSGNETGSMNLEHAWPQSKGAGDGTNGNMNMHHLYPSRVAINSDRADLPFSEINDQLTDTWYYLGLEMYSQPQSDIDAYSEFIPGSFEPRESVKGDIARAMFYFWTIYRADAEVADPQFFDLMKDDLCLWHEQDPADAFEHERNVRIASYQDGKTNPFIMDCTLVKRAYCNTLPECIMTIEHHTETGNEAILFDQADKRFMIKSDVDAQWNLQLFNIVGQPVFTAKAGSNEWISGVIIGTGIYFVQGISEGQRISSVIMNQE